MEFDITKILSISCIFHLFHQNAHNSEFLVVYVEGKYLETIMEKEKHRNCQFV